MQLLRGRPSFRHLWAGQVVSELGNWFNFIAGLGLVRAISQGAPEVTATLVVLRLAPFGLFSPLAGALVDRWSRRRVMIVADVARAVFAFGFIFVREREDLWLAYFCTVVSTLLAAFFDAAKNAAMPNVAGDQGLLAGNALMFSSRFLLMTLGSALGGVASAYLGYEVAFVINALSFFVSAYSIWLIPEEEMRAANAQAHDAGQIGPTKQTKRLNFWTDLREGWAYIMQHSLVAALIGVNILWATGGGATNLIYDRLGSVVFAPDIGWHPDTLVAIVYTTVGAGLVVGLLMARRIGSKVEVRGATPAFIGWMLILHGLFFALAGLMPSLFWACVMIFISRVIIGIEFAVQDTLLMRLLPDNLRGRVYATDRAGEIFMMSLTGILAGWSLHVMTPRTLTIISGVLSATPGVIWLTLFTTGRLRMPQRATESSTDESAPADKSAFVPTA